MRRPTTHAALATRVVLVAACWTAFGVVSAAQIHVRELTDGRGGSWFSVFNIVYFYWCWALVTAPVLTVARAVEDASRARWWRGLVFVIGGMAIIGAQSALYVLAHLLFDRTTNAGFVATFSLVIVRHFAGNLLTLVVLVVAHAGLSFYHRTQEQQLEAAAVALRASELEAALARVRLDALVAQLRPHFLFNTLNMVSSLIAKRDQVGATRVIARLGDLLRETFANSDVSEISLDRELRFVRHYLEIAQLRFGPRLRITERVDPAARECDVPRFILQPLLENALRHGIEATPGDGWVELRADRDDESLRVEVRDSGPGFRSPAAAHATGLGLSIVRGRLQQSYGDRAELAVGNAPDGGAVVTLRMPARVRDATRPRETDPIPA